MTQIWGHRGASAHAPENTLPAFELALEHGADGIELDLQMTRDDELVVLHDETLERTTDGHGWVADHSCAQLRDLDAGGGRDGFAGTRIPLLAEVLGLVRGTDKVVNIELKNNRVRYKGMEERVLAVIGDVGVAGQVIVSSFNHYSLKTLQALGDQPLGALYADPLFKPWKYVDHLGVCAIHPPQRWASRKLIAKSRERSLRVHVWTVNETQDIQEMFNRGVDAIITDDPAHAVGLRG